MVGMTQLPQYMDSPWTIDLLLSDKSKCAAVGFWPGRRPYVDLNPLNLVTAEANLNAASSLIITNWGYSGRPATQAAILAQVLSHTQAGRRQHNLVEIHGLRDGRCAHRLKYMISGTDLC
jgi:hypothetical protein